MNGDFIFPFRHVSTTIFPVVCFLKFISDHLEYLYFE
jgi:hypothetical protein